MWGPLGRHSFEPTGAKCWTGCSYSPSLSTPTLDFIFSSNTIGMTPLNADEDATDLQLENKWVLGLLSDQFTLWLRCAHFRSKRSLAVIIFAVFINIGDCLLKLKQLMQKSSVQMRKALFVVFTEVWHSFPLSQPMHGASTVVRAHSRHIKTSQLHFWRFVYWHKLFKIFSRFYWYFVQQEFALAVGFCRPYNVQTCVQITDVLSANFLHKFWTKWIRC